MMGINQLITKQKICDALRGIQLNLNLIIFGGNEKICSREILKNDFDLEIYCSIKVFKQNEVKKLRDHRLQVRRDKLCVCAKMENRSDHSSR